MGTEINSCTVDYSIYSTRFFYVVFFWFDVSLKLSTVAWIKKIRTSFTFRNNTPMYLKNNGHLTFVWICREHDQNEGLHGVSESWVSRRIWYYFYSWTKSEMTWKNSRVKKIDAEKLLFLDDKHYSDTVPWNHTHAYSSWATAQISSPTDNLQVIASCFCNEQIRG